MNGKKFASHRPLGSDMVRVDAHEIQPEEYEEIPELTEEMLAIAIINNRPQLNDDPNRDKPV